MLMKLQVRELSKTAEDECEAEPTISKADAIECLKLFKRNEIDMLEKSQFMMNLSQDKVKKFKNINTFRNIDQVCLEYGIKYSQFN